MAIRSDSSCGVDLRFLLLFSFFMIIMHANYMCFGNSVLTSSRIEIKTINYLPKTVEVVNHNFKSRYINGNIKKNGIRIIHWNPGSKHLHNKLVNIESLINMYQPGILGISESNFFRAHDINDVQIANYKLYFSETLHNDNLGVSRIAVYVHTSIACKLRTDLMNNTFSSIWLEVNLPRQKKFLICHAYREWQYLHQLDTESRTLAAQSSRWMEFLGQWKTAIMTNLECLVLGDLNIDHTTWTEPNPEPSSSTYRLRDLIQNLFEQILPLGAVQCVKGATRFENGSVPSGLDHFWTTNPNKLSDVHTYFHGSSDHKIILGTRFTKSRVASPKFIKKRSYKHFDERNFLDAVTALSWWDLYRCEDPEEAARIFTNKLNSVLDEMAPVKKFQVRNHYAPWLTSSTKALITERDLAQLKAAKSGAENDWKLFKQLRNRINNKLKAERRQWQARRLENCTNTSDTWRIIKSWLGWSCGGPPTRLVVDGELKSKPKELAECMNEFFTNKVKSLRARIPPCRKDPLDRLRTLMANRKCSFTLKPVHPDEVRKIIKKLKNTKTCGTDHIDAYVLKLAIDQVVPALTHVVNLSLNQAQFPAIWKTAKVVPLLKKSDETQPKNYRPVSLLAITSKILERAVYQQLVEYLESNNLFHHSHHGFRRHHSTTTALLEMYSNWIQSYEENKITAVVLLDMSAAFDLVDKSILLDKLKLYGVDGHSSNWLESYMSNRYQRVFVDGELSDPLPLEVGVPQGSILGPLLYCIMVNDLPEIPHNHEPDDDDCDPSFWNLHCSSCGGIACFADDSSYSKSGDDPQTSNQQLKSTYASIVEYMAANKLVLNTDKTHLLVMASERQHRLYGNYGVELDTGNEIILPEEHDRLLGCQIKCNFRWVEHLLNNEASLQRQITSRINALKKISYAATFKTRKMVANGVIMSRIIYAIQLWGGASDFLLNILQVLQNRAARIVTRKCIYTSQKELLKQCGWLNVRQLVFLHDMVLVYKTLREKKPVSLYKSLSKSFTYRTRAASTGALVDNYRTTKDLTKGSFLIRATKAWNTLPPEVRVARSLPVFKSMLKNWIQINVS